MPWVDKDTGAPIKEASIAPPSPMARPPMEAGATTLSPPTDDEVTDLKHPWFAKFRKPATAIAERMITPPLMGKPGPISRFAARAIVPQDPTDAAITAGLMATGIGEAQLGLPIVDKLAGSAARRMATMAGAGAAGDLAGGGSGWRGALKGELTQAPSEAIAGAAGWINRYRGEKPLLKKTLSDAGNYLTSILPDLGTLSTDKDFSEQLVKGKAVDRIGENLRGVKQAVSDATSEWHPRGAQPKLMMVPTLGKGGAIEWRPLSFEEADAALTEIDKHGYSLAGDPKSAVEGAKMRRASHQGRELLADQVNQIVPGMGDLYRSTQKKFSAAESLKRIFNTKGVFNPDGTVDTGKLANLIGGDSEFYTDLKRTLGEKETDTLLDQMVLRGRPGMQRDIPGDTEHVGIRFGPIPHPHASLPHAMKPVGRAPLSYNPPRAPISLLLKKPAEGAVDVAFPEVDNL